MFFVNIINSKYAKEFYFKGNNTGVLLIHGFTGTPYEMRFLGEFLRSKGYTVRGILLKGHGTTPKDMKKCSFRDWTHGAVQGYKSLKQECDEVVAVGFSMGGLLSLYLARNYDIRGVVTLSAPVRIYSRAAALAFIERNLKNHMTGKTENRDIDVIGYERAPLISVHHLFKLIRYVKANLKYIKKPVLVMQSYGDRAVRPKSANIIYSNIGSKDKSIIYLHKSGHVITCDKEKERVFEEVYNFIKDKSAFGREKNREEERCSCIAQY